VNLEAVRHTGCGRELRGLLSNAPLRRDTRDASYVDGTLDKAFQMNRFQINPV
jgi:hypothetical protein